MAAGTNVLASGTSTPTASSSVVVTTTPVSLVMMGNATPQAGNVGIVQIEDSSGNWVEIGRLEAFAPIFLLTAPGTYQVTRVAAYSAWGVDQN